MKLAKNSLSRMGLDYYDWHYEIFYDLADMVGMGGEVLCECGHRHRLYLKGHTSFKCGNCQKAYSPMAGTSFANSKILLPLWLKAIYIIDKNPKIILSDLTRELDCTNVTACNIRKKIRCLDKGGIEYQLMKKHERMIIEDINHSSSSLV